MNRKHLIAACAAFAFLTTSFAATAGESQDKPKRVPSMMTGSSKSADKNQKPAEGTPQAEQKEQGQDNGRKRCRDEKGNKKPNC